MKLKACLKSMRLRTLPLSLSGIIMGTCIAFTQYDLEGLTVIFLVLTACLLQILSNLSNELGDVLHGTDGDDRQGVHYSIQDGEMTIPQMKRLIASVAVSCCVCGALMIYFAFGTLWDVQAAVFLTLGACAVAAATRYTLGHNPYGYRGLGDLFVYIFFGLVSTLGAYYICSWDIDSLFVAVLPASAIGFFSVAVLNVNNIRDMKSDMKTRVTVAMKMGERNARIYQTLLIVFGWVQMIAFSFFFAAQWYHWLYVLTLPLFVLHLKGVWTRSCRDLDPMLPLLVLSTFALCLLAGLSLCF